VKKRSQVYVSFQIKLAHIKLTNLCYIERSRLDTHEEEAHRSIEAYYNCQFCYMGFEEESDFSRHIMFHKVKIPEERSHACETCGKTFEVP